MFGWFRDSVHSAIVKFTEMKLLGAYVIDIAPHDDMRGFFARTFCTREFAQYGLETTVAQESISFNKRRGTIRGMHFQAAPHEEAKIVRCTAGSAYDVIVDLRSGSETFGKWCATELSAANRRSVYVPAGFAHGFQTLVDDTEMLYQMTTEFASLSARGIRWNDPTLRIVWPDPNSATISERDQSYSDFDFQSTNA
jgi:dTDP-4-dehydrorhamnose 3,5-epimerase